ncbi:MAG: bifunctional phosphopantothenoylcysteine decarboxylase/phosphopantothenate--cysteine ligase CoaBC [Alphaproteobacteria bacterium]
MGSLTVRNLPESVKKRLRLRAAANGRSMEEEVRLLLAEGAAEPALVRTPSTPKPAKQSEADATQSAARRVLLIIAGGIAAYKSLDLIRRLRERDIAMRVVMTKAAQEFITPMSVGAIAGEKPFTELFDQPSEFDVGHIRLARDSDLIVVAPATADIMAKMANGHADDLATAVLLATDKQVLLAPAMNARMWSNKPTQRNLKTLLADGVVTVGPNAGEMAESGEAGLGRMAEPLEIVAAIEKYLAGHPDATDSVGGTGMPLAGKRILVTAGPTHEPIDPVRYIANRSSGKQGHAIARATAAAGASVTLVTGPVNLPDPPGVKTVRVESARDMLKAVEAALPVDVGVFAAAVADWRTADAGEQKLKKDGSGPPQLALVENPDILATVSELKAKRPPLVIGFAAETEKVIEHAKAKLKRKGCDWILANDVSAESGVMGGDANTIHLVTAKGVEHWPTQSKDAVAAMLVGRIAESLKGNPQ